MLVLNLIIVKIFNTMRAVITCLVSPILGLIADYSPWSSDEFKKDITSMLLPFGCHFTVLLIFSISLFFTTLPALWVVMITISIISSWVYVYENVGVGINFPSCTGIVFSIIENIGGGFIFLATPLINHVLQQDDLGHYFIVMIVMTLSLLLNLFILIPLMKKTENDKENTSTLTRLDKARSESAIKFIS